MDTMMGIILTEDQNTQLGLLTEKRAISAMPMAGRYRLIDFILSNMVNSGIIHVGVATQFNYSSLMDHLGSGKPWDLSRKNCGLYILPPFIGRESSGRPESGDLDVLFGIARFLRRSSQRYVVLSEGHLLFNMTFGDMLRQHIDTGADITILYNEDEELDSESRERCCVLDTDESGRVTDLVKAHPHPAGRGLSMEVYLMERTLLLRLVEDAVAHGRHDLVLDVLMQSLNRLKVYGYRFDGYVGRIDTIDHYFQHNMKLLDPQIRSEIFSDTNKIYTKVKDEVPTHYGEHARICESMVADGCDIDATVENCVIFRGVSIGRGAVVKNSIIMQNCQIGQNCFVENALLDKEVTLLPGKTLMGQPSYPFVVSKGSVV